MKKVFLMATFMIVTWNCDNTVPNGNIIPPPPLSSGSSHRYPEIVLDASFKTTPIIKEETDAIEISLKAQARNGKTSKEYITRQVEGLMELDSLFNEPDQIVEAMEITGGIQGYEYGMTIEEYSSQAVQIIAEEITQFPLEVLKQYRNEIVVSIYNLSLMYDHCKEVNSSKCEIFTSMMEKQLYLREKVIHEIQSKMKEELENQK